MAPYITFKREQHINEDTANLWWLLFGAGHLLRGTRSLFHNRGMVQKLIVLLKLFLFPFVHTFVEQIAGMGYSNSQRPVNHGYENIFH